MSLYAKKLFRELKSQAGQSLTVMLVTGLGVMLFVTTGGSYADLRDSYASTRSRLALATVQLSAPVIDAQASARVGTLPEVQTTEIRLVVEVPVNAGSDRATLRIISLPDDGWPALDQALVIEGTRPGPGQVLLDKHFARFHHLTPGQRLELAGGAEALVVSGVAVSPEYLWVSRSENDFMPTPHTFGVGWMRRSALRATASTVIEKGGPAASAPALALAAGGALGNEMLVMLAPEADARALVPRLEAAVGQGPAVHATPTADMVGIKLMQMDLDGYKGMAAIFPLFFLGIGAFIVGSALSRIVDSQRPVIGTLMALGVGRGKILFHYLSWSLVLGSAGAVLGAVLGQAAAPAMAGEYAKELGIPFVEWSLRPGLMAWGIAMGVGVAALAGLIPALRAMQLAPAVAMRPAIPRLGWLARLSRRLPLPLPLKLAVRDVLGRPLRSFGTALGVASAVVLVLSTGVLLDAMRTTFSALFEKAMTYDVRVDFAAPVPAEQAKRRLDDIGGVHEAEALLVLPARVSANGHSVNALLQALEPAGTLLKAVDVDGTAVSPSPGGIAITRAAAKQLGVAEGDRVEVTALPDGPTLGLEVDGFADAAMGTTVTVQRADADRAFATAGLATALVARADPDTSASVRDALERRFPGALRVEDAAATREQFDLLMGLGWLMLGAMLVFAGVLAAAILFSTATLTMLERKRDLATLRALGHTMRELTAFVTIEHGLLAAFGIAMGLPLAVLCSKLMLHAFESALFSLPFVLTGSTVTVTVVGVLVVVLLAQWPSLHRLGKTNLAEAVRARDGG